MKKVKLPFLVFAALFTHFALAGSAKAGAVKVQSTNRATTPASQPPASPTQVQQSHRQVKPVVNNPAQKNYPTKGYNDPVVQEAMVKTQGLMQDPKQRSEAIARDPKAKQADDMIQRLSGGDAAATNDIYALASQIFANLVQQANGDPKKMEELIEQFKRDPASFAATWTPEQKAQLKAIAGQLENVKPQAPK